MRIGFDAKRAFFNFSGLGNYSRNTIAYLGSKYPENEYHLYIPRRKLRIPNGEMSKYTLEYPQSWTGRKLSSFWRSYWLGKRLEKDRIEVYHGLSNEIPFDLPRPKVRSVVTIHDLIFMRYPEWYRPIDRKIYVKKAKHACQEADRIIAISNQTSSDIQEYTGTSPDRIDVVHQGCDPVFYSPVSEDGKKQLKQKYSLPSDYILYVGTIEPRKNLLKIVQALHSGSLDIPLIIIGRATPYIETVREFIGEHGMKNIRFLKDVPNEDLPGIYQLADAFIYPSRFEGFGIPILEALFSRTPVITSSGSCFDEAGGKSSMYIDPDDTDEMIHAIRLVLEDKKRRSEMQEKGYEHAQKFKEEIIADNLMEVYRKVI